jgi:putative tricarboxylic transport membrane protein
MLENLLHGLRVVAVPDVLMALIAGVVVGYIVGALPGLTSSIGMALLIPFTFDMDPIASIVMLVTIYMASDYGGAIPAIIVNAPGEPASAVTSLDGYAMTVRGEAAQALNLSLTGSTVGAFASIVLLMVSAQAMADAALAFGPAEYAALAILGLSLIGVLSTGSALKAMIGLMFGLTIVTIGIDPIRGTMRFVFDDMLIDGIPFLPALMGLFALSEVFVMLERGNIATAAVGRTPPARVSFGALWPWRATVVRASLIGYAIGVIPGAGKTIASLVSYGLARRGAANPETFGRGNPEGVVAAETANNAAVSGSLAPLLSLGVPGSSSAAVLIGGLTIHGLQPGPLLFTNNPEIPYSIFVGLLAGLPMMVLVGVFGAPLWVRLTLIPQPAVAAIVAGITLLGAYAATNNTFEMLVAGVFGVIGWLLRKVDIQPAPIVLALVLGDMLEANLRRAMVTANDNLLTVVSRPLAAALLLGALLVLASPLLGALRRSLGRRAA